MASVIGLPKLSDTMEEGAIANWLKKEGDAVREGEALVEIETDKATVEYQSPEGGTLVKIVAQPGKTMPLNTPIAVFGKKGESVNVEETLAKYQASLKAPHGAAKKDAPKESPKDGPGTPAVGVGVQPAAAPAGDGRTRSSPLARKMAADAGISLGSISGSGPQGRVIQRDVQAALAAGGVAAPAPAAAPVRVVAGGADRVLPVSMMRKTIAKRLLQGKNDAPHFYLTVSADMANAVSWRARLNEGVAKDPSLPKVSLNDIVILAVSRALRRHPAVNASWQGDSIIEFGGVHVCMAVALPTGLVTPVIRHTDQLGVRDIAMAAKSMAEKAKGGSLTNEDYAGGTFTISNLGMFGIEEFTAIINPPQAAILAVGAAMPQPWVNSSGVLVVQTRMKMTLSCDHRAVDGATGAQFLQTLVKYLEDPMMILV